MEGWAAMREGGRDGGGGCVREVSFQIPAKAGTTLRALACFKSGVVEGALFLAKEW